MEFLSKKLNEIMSIHFLKYIMHFRYYVIIVHFFTKIGNYNNNANDKF